LPTCAQERSAAQRRAAAAASVVVATPGRKLLIPSRLIQHELAAKIIYCNTNIFLLCRLIISTAIKNGCLFLVAIILSNGCLTRSLLKIDRYAHLFFDQSRASKNDTRIKCFLAVQYRARSPKQVSFSLSRGSLPSILYLSLFHSLSLFSHSLPIWRSPFSPDLEAVGLESNIAPGSQAGGRRRVRQLGSCLASLSLHYDVKRGDRGGATT
jgi:hypothetical protein